MHPVAVVWADELGAYDFGPDHPLAPVRVELTMSLARAFGVLDLPNVEVITPDVVDDELLQLVHSPDYIDAVRAEAANGRFGLGTPDVPV